MIDKISFPEINLKIQEFNNELIRNSVDNAKTFRKWKEKYSKIYGFEHANLELFLRLSILFFIGNNIFNRLLEQNDCLKENITFNLIEEISLSEVFYYKDFIDSFNEDDRKQFEDLIRDIIPENTENLPKYLDTLVKNLVSTQIRHKTGEFYTPPFLVKKMVKNSYSFGDRVIDPSCGTGNFLVEIINVITESERTKNEKEKALRNIYGIDINPISLIFARVNILNASKDFIIDLKMNLINADFLFIEDDFFEKKFDLIIGNPPWYTLRDISSLEYQENVKNLADELGIKPQPKNILNIEIASLFFYKAQKCLMENDSKVSFVLPKGILTGSHASRFRNFIGFKNMKIWSFDESVIKTFNIDFICLFAEFAEKDSNLYLSQQIELPEIILKFKEGKGINFALEMGSKQLIEKEQKILVPYATSVKNDKRYVQKFISKKKYSQLIKFKESPYKNLFHKGADLNPRNLIFVETEDIGNSSVKINPDDRIFKRAKTPWNKRIFENQIVNKDNIFQVVKSTELISFNLFDIYNVFLPLNKKDLKFDYTSLDSNSRHFYNFINGYYLNNKKRSTKKTSLIENLNHWQKLITPRQLSHIKVVYNNSGSILTSALIRGDYLVTGDLSFYDTISINEAYYLTAILNSRLVNKQIKIKKSSRHIFKIPFDIPIPLFKNESQLHLDIAKLGEEGHKKTQKIVSFFRNKNPHMSKFKLQKIVDKRLNSIFEEIDEKLHIIFGI